MKRLSALEVEISLLESKLERLKSMTNEQYDIQQLEGRVRELERRGFWRRVFSAEDCCPY